jgi:DNA repair protein SbcD/Mre11
MRPFSFIHAADLHIDSPFQGVTDTESAPTELAEALYSSTFQAFDHLIETALEREADFMVIAGDVYDGQDRSLRAQLRLRDGLDRLEGAKVSSFIIHGNHDPLDSHVSALDWPERSHFFGYKIETIPALGRDGTPVAMVTGISYRKREESRNLASKFERQDTELFQIGLLHSNVDGNPDHGNYAPCTLADLQAANLDYWALGHVHTRSILNEAPWAVYPGNTQGRSIREQGPKGCYLVQVDEAGNTVLEFIALDMVRWAEIDVAIEDTKTIDALERLVREKVDGLVEKVEGRALVCRVILTGRGHLHAELRREGAAVQLQERLRERLAGRTPFIWVQRLVAETRPEADLEDRRQRGDLLAEVLTIAREYEAEDGALCKLFEEALTELWGNTRVEKARLGAPTEEDVARMLRDAELLCLDHLEGEE